MTLVDSSAWIELFRATGSAVHLRLKASLENRDVLATTDVVLMEILAGARDEEERDWLRRFLYGRRFLPVQGPTDYESAAELYRLCRRGGETPRRLIDCLIAAIAIRNDAEMLCVDSDFETIARHTPLRLMTA
ncbi:MAG: PIN domain nuclease [Solirubrobacterales bacterium]